MHTEHCELSRTFCRADLAISLLSCPSKLQLYLLMFSHVRMELCGQVTYVIKEVQTAMRSAHTSRIL